MRKNKVKRRIPLAGVKLLVVFHEVILEIHRNGHQTPVTLGLIRGFAPMMILDTTLG